MTIADPSPAVEAAPTLPEQLAALPQLPGVYRFLGARAEVLYVGKARNLARRVTSYFGGRASSARIQLMVKRIERLEITVTSNETEALLLEANLIKALKPRYNILFRDDKSYPYIRISDHPYPRLSYFRGNKDRDNQFFGPYASVHRLREVMKQMQTVFRLRTCSDNIFQGRTRPCLLYQIRRCSGPCVGLVSGADYAATVAQTGRFLRGEIGPVLKDLQDRMVAHAEREEFEQAALLRNQIAALTGVVASQAMEAMSGSAIDANVDIIAIALSDTQVAVNLAIVRGGRHLGDRAILSQRVGGLLQGVEGGAVSTIDLDPNLTTAAAPDPDPSTATDPIEDSSPDSLETVLPPANLGKSGQLVEEEGETPVLREALELFLLQHYALEALPDRLVLPLLPGAAVVAVLNERAGRQVVITTRPRSLAAAWMQSAQEGAQRALEEGQGEYRRELQQQQAVAAALGMALVPGVFMVECFDVSHTAGEATQMGCVVYQGAGFQKSLYRRYNVHGLAPGDDYGALRQGLERHFRRITGESSAVLADLILIDGGEKQVAVAVEVLRELGLPWSGVVGIKKGEGRRVGLEAFCLADGRLKQLPADDKALLWLAKIRDEAHRFAITGMRGRRDKARSSSSLEQLPGIGATRRRRLLMHFGSIRALENASVEDLARVEGVSNTLAKRIYAALHP